MNIPRYIAGSCAVWIFISVFDWMFHEKLLGNLYAQTAELWRPRTEMQHYMPWMVIGQLTLSFLFGYIFLKGYENRGVGEGFRYGFLIGWLFAPSNLIWYAVMPLPADLIVSWIVGGVFECALAGMIMAAIYRPPPARDGVAVTVEG